MTPPGVVLVLALALAGSGAACGGPAPVAPPLAPASPRADATQAPATGPPARASAVITEVTVHGGSLWLRDGDGGLVALEPATGATRRHLADELVVDLHRAGDDRRLWALTLARASDDARVWQRTVEGWRPIAEMPAPATALLALADREGRPLVLTTRALYAADEGGAFEVRALDQELGAGRAALHVATTSGLVYVGSGSGALWRIEAATGHVENLAGPDADPVTGLVVDPERAGCVLAASGELRVGPRGRLVRVCDRTATVAWEAPAHPHERADARLALAPLRVPSTRDDCGEGAAKPCIRLESAVDPEGAAGPRGAEAILDLGAAPDGYWMVTDDAIYRSRGGKLRRHDFPVLAARGGVMLGAVPGAWLVAGDGGERDGGFAPRIAPPLDATEGGASLPAEPVPPIGSCWQGELGGPRDTPIVLCFGRERYVVIDERGPTRGSVAWTARDDGAWSLRVGAGATLELHLDREGAVVRRRMSDETRSARLYRVEAARARAILARVGAP